MFPPTAFPALFHSFLLCGAPGIAPAKMVLAVVRLSHGEAKSQRDHQAEKRGTSWVPLVHLSQIARLLSSAPAHKQSLLPIGRTARHEVSFDPPNRVALAPFLDRTTGTYLAGFRGVYCIGPLPSLRAPRGAGRCVTITYFVSAEERSQDTSPVRTVRVVGRERRSGRRRERS